MHTRLNPSFFKFVSFIIRQGTTFSPAYISLTHYALSEMNMKDIKN